MKNDPAFPSGTSWVDAEGFHSQNASVPGLTKLEWFAGMALQGLIAGSVPGELHDANYWTVMAFNIAEAMLAEAEKRSGVTLNLPISGEGNDIPV